MSKQKVFRYAILSLVFALFVVMPIVYAIEPFGATVTLTNVSRPNPDVADSELAFAGNVSELIIQGYSDTQAWQGYYGNVTGTIQLADAADFVMYNWSSVNPSGEVYATVNNTVLWVNIQCFNFTATGVLTNENANGGTTSLFGTNLTQLEARYNINATFVDGVDETFTLLGGATHDQFYTANKLFSQGECRNTRVYDSSGTGISDRFEEALLYEPATSSVVFASIIETDSPAFNTKTTDFEMLVLEDGHGTDLSSTTYYFFVELE